MVWFGLVAWTLGFPPELPPLRASAPLFLGLTQVVRFFRSPWTGALGV